jgi:hypothetical protein
VSAESGRSEVSSLNPPREAKNLLPLFLYACACTVSTTCLRMHDETNYLRCMDSADMARLRWSRLTPEERSEAARRAARARWEKATPADKKAVGRTLSRARKAKKPRGKKRRAKKG